MRRFVPGLALTLVALASLADGILLLDKDQGAAALRMIRPGETVRLYCAPCADVTYSALEVRERELEPVGKGFRLVVNGDAVDVTSVYVDDGYGDGWENLALLLGFLDERIARKLKASLAETSRLAAHTGRYAGTLGSAPITMELLLRGGGLVGSYSSGEDGTYRLNATAFRATRRAESLVLIERDSDDRVTATLRGELDAAGTFEGVRKPLDGSPEQPFALTRAESEAPPRSRTSEDESRRRRL